MLEEVRLGNDFFDKDFFAYLEDVDLAFRGRLLGWSFFYEPRAIVHHRGSVSSKQLADFFKEHISRRNRIWWVIKNIPRRFLLRFLLAYLRPTKEGIAFGLTNPKTTIFAQTRSFLFAGVESLPSLPAMLEKRQYIQRSRRVSDKEIDRWFKELTWSP